MFQALRPVFNDYVAEIQRSIGYFSSVNRDAKITKVLGVGNGFKLAGLQKFLQQNLQHPVERVDRLQGVVGDAVLNDETFRDNVAGFVVPYGIALQAAGLTRIGTSLLPPEIVQERKIRQKKPWAALAAGGLLAALAVGSLGYGNSYAAVSEDKWGGTERAVKDFNAKASGLKSDYDGQIAAIATTGEVSEQLTSPVSGRNYWPEVYQAIAAALPGEPGSQADRPITERDEVRVETVAFAKKEDLGEWFAGLDKDTKALMSPEDRATAPEGPGYVVTLTGRHYHDGGSVETRDTGYLQSTVMANLRKWTIGTPVGPIPVGKQGISHPALQPITEKTIKYDPEGRTERGASARRGGMMGMMDDGGLGGDEMGDDYAAMMMGEEGMGGGLGAKRPGADLDLSESEKEPEYIDVTEYPFTLEFVWKKTPPAERTDEPPAVETDPAAAGAALE